MYLSQGGSIFNASSRPERVTCRESGNINGVYCGAVQYIGQFIVSFPTQRHEKISSSSVTPKCVSVDAVASNIVPMHQFYSAFIGIFQNFSFEITAPQIWAHLRIMTGSHQQPRGHPLIVFPDRHDFRRSIKLVAIIMAMGNVSGMEISAVIGHGNRRGIEILEQFEVSFSSICPSYHIAVSFTDSS